MAQAYSLVSRTINHQAIKVGMKPHQRRVPDEIKKLDRGRCGINAAELRRSVDAM